MAKSSHAPINPDDVDAAIEFVNESYERDVQPEDLQLRGVKQMKPHDFVDDASHLGPANSAGWLREYPESEWLSELKSTYSRDFDHILAFHRRGEMPPGIQIDDEMGDGRGRAQFHHALGIKTMPVAVYVTKK